MKRTMTTFYIGTRAGEEQTQMMAKLPMDAELAEQRVNTIFSEYTESYTLSWAKGVWKGTEELTIVVQVVCRLLAVRSIVKRLKDDLFQDTIMVVTQEPDIDFM